MWLLGLNFGDVIIGGANYADAASEESEEKKTCDTSDVEESPPKKAKLEAETSTEGGETEQTVMNSSATVVDCTPSNTESEARTCTVSKRKVFFQRPGTTEYESFFPLANEAGRSGEVDCPSVLCVANLKEVYTLS